MNGCRMFGVETEYAVTAFDRAGAPLSREECVVQLLRRARNTIPHQLGSGASDLYLQNGSRLYIDAGHHPELSSPECLNPWDVVRYVRAGDVILERLADGVKSEDDRIDHVLVFKGNVDYSGSGTTWGSHESYLHRSDPDLLRRRLIPHLVSRVIYTGAGGFNPLSSGLEFMLSPRAAHLAQVVSHQSTWARGIIHTRDESLSASGYRRQHLICGESQHSDLATWLRVGVTAVIVAMIDAGIPCGDEVAIESPLEALNLFARDVCCDATVAMAGGSSRTAVQIQRQYLAHAHKHQAAPFMPVWTERVCTEWAAMLARIEETPQRLTRTLDWAIKLAVYQDRARRRGIEWKTLPSWTHIVESLERKRQTLDQPGQRLSAEIVLAEDSPLRDTIREVTPYLEAKQIQWSGLDPFLKLRQELFEVDTRFGRVGPGGLFSVLDRSGRLDHRVTGVDRIAEAIDEPPAEGRAHVRGEVIRRAVHDGTELGCAWSSVVNRSMRLRLDLSDPFTMREEWEAVKPPPPRTAPVVPASANPGPPSPSPPSPTPPAAPQDAVRADDEFSIWGDLVELCSRIRRPR